MKKLTAIVAAAACGALALAMVGCGGGKSADGAEMTLVEEGKLTIGTDFDYPPFTFLDENGQPGGFEAALMTEVCDRIGLEPNYLSPQNFDTLLTQVDSGATMDVAVSGITINDERLELVDFTDPYFDSNLAIVTLADKALTAREDMAGLRIGGQSGTSGEDWVKENFPDAEYIPYTSITDALTALRADKVDVLVYDEPVANAHTKGEYTDCAIFEVIATGEQYGIVVNKNNPALTAAINQALADIVADGTMDKLLAESFK